MYLLKMLKHVILFMSIIYISWGKDYYELLGIKKDADQKEIRRAFKKLAVTEHPDKKLDDPAAHEKFIKITTAYEILKDEESRKKYDLYGEEGLDDSNKGRTYQSWNYYQNNFGIYDDDPEIVTLNKNDYFDAVYESEKIWIINFYSPMCGHCHQLAPIWRKVAKELEGVVRIGAVNCEDDWHLCHQIEIQSYPILLYYPKNSQHGIRYTGEKSHNALVRFVLDKLDVALREISESVWNHLMQGEKIIKKPILIFICGTNHNCFSLDDQRKVAAIFDKMIDVQSYTCYKDKCDNTLSYSTNAVYLPVDSENAKTPIIFDETNDINELIPKILQMLPEPQDLNTDEFKSIRKRLEEKTEKIGWLICFYLGQATELNLVFKKLPGIIKSVKIGKINCGKYSMLCQNLNINRYPMWGVLKPGGAFELSHGKNVINDIAKFAESSIKAVNIRALSDVEVLSIMQRTNGKEVWFLDWYAPWCPPCIKFLPELRKASLNYNSSDVQFGTIDCTIYSSICRQYNIRSYPTAMLINGTETHQFLLQKTASNIVEFINDIKNPTVIEITSKNFNLLLGRKPKQELWVVDYFAPWCGPCQQLAYEWRAVAKTLQSLKFVKIANVNCDKESVLCKEQGIRSYPTIRLYPIQSEGLNTVVMYSGARDSLSLLKWIAEFFPNKIQDLNPNTFEKEVLNSKKIWLVDFFAPWCGHCQKLEPHFTITAQLLGKRVRLGRVNCDYHRSLCMQANVRAYPTLLLYNSNRSKKRKIEDGYRIDGSTYEQILEIVEPALSPNSKRDEL